MNAFVSKFHCPLSPTGYCKHGGNKAYHYGFMRGMASYCRKAKRWLRKPGGESIACPLATAAVMINATDPESVCGQQDRRQESEAMKDENRGRP